MEIIILLVGLAFAAIGAIVLKSAIDTSRSGQRTDGEVIGYAESRGGKNSSVTYAPVFAFQHPLAGRCIAQHPISSGSFPYMIGDRVRVLYSMDPPFGARIDTEGTQWFGGIFAVTGVAVVALFFSIFRWSASSIAFSLAVLGVIAWQLWKRKASIPDAQQIEKGLRNAAMSEVAQESTFDRATLMQRSDIESRMRRQPGQALVSGIIILLLGAGCVVWSWFWVGKRFAFLQQARRAQGRIVDMERSSGSKGTTWAPIVEFTPDGSATAVRFRHSVASSNPSYQVGDGVQVLYDPNRPHDAMIDGGRWNRLVPFIPGGIGALLFLGGIASIRRSRRQAARLQALTETGLA